jgi:hypothetical protein
MLPGVTGKITENIRFVGRRSEMRTRDLPNTNEKKKSEEEEEEEEEEEGRRIPVAIKRPSALSHVMFEHVHLYAFKEPISIKFNRY